MIAYGLCTVILLFSLLGLYFSLRNVTDEDLVYFGCLYVPMDVYYCVGYMLNYCYSRHRSIIENKTVVYMGNSRIGGRVD